MRGAEHEALQVLKAFYLELRAKAMATEGAPITTRQLESLVRLAEARARSTPLQNVPQACASGLTRQ